MRRPRLAGTGLGLVAITTFALAGCAADTDPGGPNTGGPNTGGPNTGGTASSTPTASASAGPSAPSGPADPAATAALSSAAATLGTTSFKITMTVGPGVALKGAVDAPQGVGTARLDLKGSGAALTVDSLLVGEDLYVRVPGVTTADKWTHVDVSRLPEGANVGLRPGRIDPADTARLLTTSTDVQPAGARSYRGTLDLTRAAGITGIDKVTVDGWGQAAQRVPFTAGLDEQGRLSQLTLDLPAVAGQQAQPLEVLYTDYGSAVTVQKPAAAAVTEAPESLYATLNG